MRIGPYNAIGGCFVEVFIAAAVGEVSSFEISSPDSSLVLVCGTHWHGTDQVRARRYSGGTRLDNDIATVTPRCKWGTFDPDMEVGHAEQETASQAIWAMQAATPATVNRTYYPLPDASPFALEPGRLLYFETDAVNTILRGTLYLLQVGGEL